MRKAAKRIDWPLRLFLSADAPDSRLGIFFWQVLPRGLALFIGAFCLLNLVGGFLADHFDANLWWIDVRAFPEQPANLFLLISAICLLSYAVFSASRAWRRWLTVAVCIVLAAKSLGDMLVFYHLAAKGIVHAAVPIPLSLFVTAALALIIAAHVRTSVSRNSLPRFAAATLVGLACAILFPLGQMFCFGKTDYRRRADVAVVFGARVYADGRLSDALADRVRTACALYRQGLAGKLLFSGGPGDGSIHETEAMRRMAVRLGVNDEDIILDPAGLNTQATVNNTDPLFRQLHASRILAVSHFYHLPRIKMAYQRAGYDVYTVPAKESYLLRQMPYNVAREVAALWVYYLRPLKAI